MKQLSQLPAAITAQLSVNYPGHSFTHFYSIVKDNTTYYGCYARIPGKMINIELPL